jgi:hypothetical protein
MKLTSGCGKEVKRHVEHIANRIMKQIVKRSTKHVRNKMKNDPESTCHTRCRWRIVTGNWKCSLQGMCSLIFQTVTESCVYQSIAKIEDIDNALTILRDSKGQRT